MEHSIYGWIEAYARGLCDTDSFTGEITALCCRGPAMEGVSEAEALRWNNCVQVRSDSSTVAMRIRAEISWMRRNFIAFLSVYIRS